jgi:purine-binding chemotaxis protein CheW
VSELSHFGSFSLASGGGALQSLPLGETGIPDNRTPAPEIFSLPAPDFWHEETSPVRGDRYLAFELAGATYALPLAHIREVDRMPSVTALPNAPAWLLGAANLRGEIISVVDLAAFLGLTKNPSPRNSRLLACRVGNMEAGLVIERIRDIRELPDVAIRPPAGSVPGRAARYLAGVHAGDGRLTLILDIPRLFQSQEFRRFE